jgi:hypothetical protein
MRRPPGSNANTLHEVSGVLIVSVQLKRLHNLENDGVHGARQVQGITRSLELPHAEQHKSSVELEDGEGRGQDLLAARRSLESISEREDSLTRCDRR